MKRLFLLLLCMVAVVDITTAQSDYYIKKAQSYQREAGNHLKLAY